MITTLSSESPQPNRVIQALPLNSNGQVQDDIVGPISSASFG